MQLIAATVLIFCSQLCAADTLTTASYVVTITRHCEEGDVSCNNVSYHGVSKKTGKSIDLKGSAKHAMCADGVTPCQFLGYQFKTGNISYLVLESGALRVVKGDKDVLVDEMGEWTY
ncbi:hypothetical protein A1342_19045 [Methylomonas methanica]|uniref:Uncharacterized protein n=1 Tax=Methylomonas denitrificans TaxID=1538553 RepID=A0A126T3J5_9GAMM|nr:hypothetical protein JT25_009200 [Methylomonas denitrificans]OAH97255.1 hypothetical protein A1342_19045 [Methylomonas methanica]